MCYDRGISTFVTILMFQCSKFVVNRSVVLIMLNICSFRQTIKQFLIDNDGGFILREFAENGSLNDLKRKRLVHICTDMLVKVYGNNPSKQERLKFASVMTQMFPFLTVVSLQIVYSANIVFELRCNRAKTCMLFSVNIFLGIW